jgi:hypothetical protein
MSSLNFDRHYFHVQPIAFIKALKSLNQLPPARMLGNLTLVFSNCKRYDRVKLPLDFRFKLQRRSQFAKLPFNFANGILLSGGC